MDLEHAIKNRRSIRLFKEEPVPIAKIEKAIEAATFAPSASNKQHWHFIVIDDKNIISRLSDEAGAQDIVKRAPKVIAVLYSRNDNPDHYANIQSASAAVQNLLLKAFELGLGACWVCGFGDEKKAANILGVPAHYGLLCLVIIGIPKQQNPPAPPKKKVSEVMSINKFRKNDAAINSIRTSEWNIAQIIQYKKMASAAKGLGKDYEIYNADEIKAVNDEVGKLLPRVRLRILNFLGYDGTLFKHLYPVLSNHEVTDCELDATLADFVKYKVPEAKYLVIGPELSLKQKFDLIIIPFSLEKYPLIDKLPQFLQRSLSEKGKAIILLKNKHSPFGIMYFALNRLLGLTQADQYFYGGPFEPIAKSEVVRQLKNAGFGIKTKSLFAFPPEIEDYRRMAKGYMLRHGSKLRLSFLVRPSLAVISRVASSLNTLKLPHPASTLMIIASKTNTSKIAKCKKRLYSCRRKQL